MPLVILCGYPSSGKSTIATLLIESIKNYIEEGKGNGKTNGNGKASSPSSLSKVQLPINIPLPANPMVAANKPIRNDANDHDNGNDDHDNINESDIPDDAESMAQQMSQVKVSSISQFSSYKKRNPNGNIPLVSSPLISSSPSTSHSTTIDSSPLPHSQSLVPSSSLSLSIPPPLSLPSSTLVYTSSPIEVHLLSHETLHLPRSSSFSSPENEKKTHSFFRANVDRLLSKNRIVILDFLNFVKGFRYELYVRSKEMNTQHCVVFADTKREICEMREGKRKERGGGGKGGESGNIKDVENNNDKNNNIENKQTEIVSVDSPSSSISSPLPSSSSPTPSPTLISQGVGYDSYSSPSIFTDLCNRLETPNEAKRWDQPLFIVNNNLPFGEMSSSFSSSLSPSIVHFIFEGKSVQQTISNVPLKGEESSFLFQLDQITMSIVMKILRIQEEESHEIGDSIHVCGKCNGASSCTTRLILYKKYHLPELKRQQNQFIKINRIRPIQEEKNMEKAFITHLNEGFK